jgi:hypothetical protein
MRRQGRSHRLHARGHREQGQWPKLQGQRPQATGSVATGYTRSEVSY